MAGGVNPFGFSGGVIPQAVRPPKRGPQDLPSAPFGFAPPPSKWEQTKDILAPYVTGPWNSMTGLMDTPLHVLLGGGTQEQQEQAVANSFNTGGSFAGASSVVTKPRNALNMGFRVFHGSPHDFPPVRLIEMPDGQRLYQNMDELMDTPQGAKIIQEFPMGRFDMSKIGTGEGAQAYGHGLYFADSEGVARSYRDALSSGSRGGDAPNFKALGNKSLRTVHPDIQHDIAEKGIPAIDARLAEIQDILKNEKQNRRFFGDEQTDEMIRVFGAEAEELNALKALGDTSINKGRMYEVEINADPDAFLDWDKPLSEQPPNVQKHFAHLKDKTLTGEDLARRIESRIWVDEAAQAGIPGIKYLDAGSRGPARLAPQLDSLKTQLADAERKLPNAGRHTAMVLSKQIDDLKRQIAMAEQPRTRNYVVFDDKLISIVKKYGIAGASAMLGYNILDGMDPAQAEELQRIEGNQ